MAYKVLDILKDLPGTNCRDCSKSGCFAFATGVYLDGADLAGCPHLSPEKLALMREKVAAGRVRGEGKKDASHVQALNHLMDKMREADLAALAKNASCAYDPGPPPTVGCDFLGQPLAIRPDEVTAATGEPPSVWVKIFLYIYLTRAAGTPEAGDWAAFRELPNSVSKARAFDGAAQSVADHYAGRPDALARAAQTLGGERVASESADAAFRFQALPRVPLLFSFWDVTEEFEARATLLVDRGVLDYLDQEALVFLAEAFAKRMTGESVSEVIP